MPRLVKRNPQEPTRDVIEGKAIGLRRNAGLSKVQPTCDGPDKPQRKARAGQADPVLTNSGTRHERRDW